MLFIWYLSLVALALVILISIAHIAIKVGRTAATYQKLLKEWMCSIHTHLGILAVSSVYFDNILSGSLIELIIRMG